MPGRVFTVAPVLAHAVASATMSAMKPFKYAHHICNVADCPPDGYAPLATEAYRWVHADLEDARNFLPPKKIKPNRRHRDDHELCGLYALSLYGNETKARRAYWDLAESFQQIAEVIGTHLAVGSVAVTDGVASKPRGGGHFEIHEFEGTSLRPKFRMVGPL